MARIISVFVELEDAGGDLQELVGEGNGIDGERRYQADIEGDEEPAARQDDALNDEFQ